MQIADYTIRERRSDDSRAELNQSKTESVVHVSEIGRHTYEILFQWNVFVLLTRGAACVASRNTATPSQ